MEGHCRTHRHTDFISVCNYTLCQNENLYSHLHHILSWKWGSTGIVVTRLWGVQLPSGVPRGVVWGVQTPPRNSEDIGRVFDRMSKKNRRLDFLL